MKTVGEISQTLPRQEVRTSADREPENVASGRRQISSFLAAFTAFLLLNAYFINLKPSPFDPFKFPQTNWMWWLVNDLRHSQDKFNVATMGSSLVLSALDNCDSTFLGKDLDLTSYHACSLFEKEAAQTFGGVFKSIDLSTCGQMPSDSYLLTRLLLQLHQHPAVIVYGLAPRDFLDCNLANERDTQNFKYLSRLVSADQLLAGTPQAPLDQIEIFLQNNCFFYRYALDLEMLIRQAATTSVDALLPPPKSARMFTADEREKLLPSYEINKVVAGALFVRKGAWKPSTKWVRDNSPYYVQAFRQPNPRTCSVQFHCLDQLTKLCASERIQLVLVNMPLSAANLNLLGAPRYQDYLSRLRTFAQTSNLPLFDLNDRQIYKDSFFEDSVHLNDFGAKYLVDALMENFAQNPNVTAAMVAAGKEAQGVQSLAQSQHNHTH
jgi:hypothetical protein